MTKIKSQTEDIGKIITKHQGWYKADSAVWGECYMREKRDLLTKSRDIKEVNIILQHLPSHCKKILDAPCGYGRISNILATKGFDVTGIDISEYFINIAESRINKKKFKIRYVTGNILTKKIPNKFDAVLNIFTSLGYLENEKKNELFIKRLCQYVKPGGRLIIEIINPLALSAAYRSKDTITARDGTVLNFERFLDIKTSKSVTTIREQEPSGKLNHLVHIIRLYYPHELINICETYGCRLVSLLNKNGKESNIINSNRIWLIFQKK